MPTPGQLNVNFQQSLMLNGLSRPDRMSLVYDLSNGWNVLTYLTDIISKHKSRQVTGHDGKIEKPLMGRFNIITTIASVTAVGANLQVMFTNPTYNLFRLRRAVMDSGRNQGRVIAVIAGGVILEPYGNTATSGFNASTMFQANMFIKDMFDASEMRNSTSATPIYEAPVYDYNFVSTCRAAAEYNYLDEENTWVEWQDGFWYTSIDKNLITQYAKDMERKAWESFRMLPQNSSLGGQVAGNGGMFWSIADPIRGGIIRTLSNNPGRTDIESFFMAVRRQQANSRISLTALIGSDALHNIQTQFLQNFITTAGKWNTVGGAEVVGIDAHVYGFAGVEIKFVVCPYFDDKEYFPEASTLPNVMGTKESNTIVVIDETEYQVKGGGTAPSMERIYFGPSEMHYSVFPGVGMSKGTNSLNISGKSWNEVVTSRDSLSFDIYSQSGIDVIANRMGLLRLSS